MLTRRRLYFLLPDVASASDMMNELLLARVGRGAMAFDEDATEPLPERGVRGASAANRLVFRQLLIWVVVIAALTLYGWTL